MRCPDCITTWDCLEDFREHLKAHGFDSQYISQLLSHWGLVICPIGPHLPDEPCGCSTYGARFACEIKGSARPQQRLI